MKLKFIPCDSNKRPLPQGWQTSTEEYDTLNSEYIGLVCGKLSGNLEVIDFDLKYDLSGDLMKKYAKLVSIYDDNLLSKLVVQKTKNNGYHFFYRCETIEGNQALAKRKSTVIEINEDANNKRKVLIETRGEGGQVIVAPSPGYELRKGKTLNDIPTITPFERDILLSCARSFNTAIDEVKTKFVSNPSGDGRMTPWDDYNLRGDVIGLLEKHGWTYVETIGERIYLKRPGNTDSKISGDYHTGLKLFKVFSTSTEFEEGKGYKPASVFVLLEANGDPSLGAKLLYQQGYGERNEYKPTKELNITQVNKDIDVEEYFASPDVALDYLMRVKEGKIELGKKFNIPELDKHFVYKRGNLIMINGVDNVGKTFMILYLMTILSKLYEYKFLIYTTENEHYSVYEDIAQFFLCKQIRHCSEDEISTAHKWVSEHFIFIKLSEKLYSHKEILIIAKEVNDKYGLDGILIDPWYSILDGDFEHGSSYKVIMEIKAFTKANNISTMINIHVGTNAARAKDKEGNLIAPGKSDTEGGQKFANVADDFITIHRNFNNPDEYDVTEIHVRKIKETKTGGKVTQQLNPIKLKIKSNFCGFDSFYGAANIVDHFAPFEKDEEEAPF